MMALDKFALFCFFFNYEELIFLRSKGKLCIGLSLNSKWTSIPEKLGPISISFDNKKQKQRQKQKWKQKQKT